MHLSRILCFLTPLVAGGLLVGCGTTGGGPSGEIAKVKYFHLQVGKQTDAADPAIPFEYRHFIHGAITSKERREKEGHYYSIAWRAAGSDPATIRFEYRQANTGSTVHRKEAPATRSRFGKSTTRIQVTGEEYRTGGKVTAWKVSLVRAGTVIATAQSFLWD